jgi:phospholipid/cholesterol/gamma-HCH transport system substrate-binding protein
VIGTEEGQDSVGNIVRNIESLSNDLKVTSGTIRKSIGEREEDMQNIVSNVRDALRDVKQFSASLRDVLDTENKEKIDRILASFDESMLEVRGATKNINMIAQKVEKGEGTLGRLVNDDTALMEIEGAVKDIREVLSPVRKLQIAVDYHGEVRGDETTQNWFNMVFKTRPDRWYIVGVTDKETSEIDRTTETLQDDPASGDSPATRRTRETIRETNALRINLQFAKRWYFVALRFGLFESSGGMASDFYLWDDRIRLSLEAFNFKSKQNEFRHVAHLKSYASILFFNHVYAMIGVDDITRKDLETGERVQKPNWFVGAGLTFDDQDIKAIFGAAALASGGR